VFPVDAHQAVIAVLVEVLAGVLVGSLVESLVARTAAQAVDHVAQMGPMVVAVGQQKSSQDLLEPCSRGGWVGHHIGGSSVVGRETNLTEMEAVPGRSLQAECSHLDMALHRLMHIVAVEGPSENGGHRVDRLVMEEGRRALIAHRRSGRSGRFVALAPVEGRVALVAEAEIR
jgi:hypothetical protein